MHAHPLTRLPRDAQAGRRLAKELRDEGAQLVVALTHMRVPNDQRLAREVQNIDLVLGGHDHSYHVRGARDCAPLPRARSRSR